MFLLVFLPCFAPHYHLTWSNVVVSAGAATCWLNQRPIHGDISRCVLKEAVGSVGGVGVVFSGMMARLS